MSAQVDVLARELLAAGWKRAGQHMIASMVRNGHNDESTRVAIGAIADALRQQPAPIDLEQFREAVEAEYRFALLSWDAGTVTDEIKAAAMRRYRLLSIIDNAGKVDNSGLRVVLVSDAVAAMGEISTGESFSKVANSLDGKAFRASAHQPAPVVDDVMRDLIEQRDTLLNALKRALPHVEHAYHTHEDLDGSFWIDVVGCRSALARVQGVKS